MSTNRFERFVPAGLALLGVAMIVTAAAGDLSDAVAVTFAVLGVALVGFGAVFGRLAPGEALEIGPQGLKAVIAQAQATAEQEGRPQEAKVLAELTEAVDDWFAEYKRQPRDPNPYVQAMRLQQAWKRRRREESK